jgi:hypothetical protein
MQHMYGHADKYLLEAEMFPAQQVNCRADKLATAALMAAVEANEFISSIFLLENGCVEIAREQVPGPPKMQSQSFGENRWHNYCMTDGGW